MFKNRLVIPKKLRHEVLQNLHSAHQGTKGMKDRASNCIYWPGINSSIEQVRQNCKFCDSIAPSQARQPLKPLPPATYPFEYVCADAFTLHGHEYLVVVDKFSGWLIIFHFRNSLLSKHIVESLQRVFRTYGTPTKLYSDGGLVFTSSETQEFLQRWGVKHVISSARYSQANGRAELAVKTAKRILHENVTSSGSLETEAASKALLQYRNTPIQGLGLSPAQVLFHRNLRDSLPARPTWLRPHGQWILAAKNREAAFARRNANTAERYNAFTRDLSPLSIGTEVLIQDHTNKKRWNETGVVVERYGRKYEIRMNGSGRIISRNRKFLRATCADRTANDGNNWNPSPQVSVPTNEGHDVSENNHNGSTSHSDHETASNDHTHIDDTEQTFGTGDNDHISADNIQVDVNDYPSNSTNNIPRMLTNLFPHNKPGLTER